MFARLFIAYQLSRYARKVSDVLTRKHGWPHIDLLLLMHHPDVRRGWENGEAPESTALMVYYS